MEQGTKVKRARRGKKREWMMGAGLIAYLIGLMIRIPLSRMIGDKGMGFFATGMEVYLLITIVLSYGLSKAVTILIKYRVKREMFKSARRVYRSAMFLAVGASAVAAVGVFAFSEVIAEIFMLEHMSYLAIAAAAPAICLSAIIGVLRGYFQGMGAMLPTVHSRLLEKLIMIAASLIAASIMYTYGLKVANLLKNTEYAAAYGAMGAAIGISVAALFAVLHLVLMHTLYAGTFKQQLMKDTSKYTESKGELLSMLLTTALPYMLCAVLYNMNYLVDQRLFNYAMNIKEKGSVRAAHWGVYYGKYSVLIGAAAVVCTLLVMANIPKIVQLYERQERREAQQKLGKTMHALAVWTIPGAVWFAVLAQPLVELLFKGDTNTAVSLVQIGSFVIVLFPFAYLFMNILQRMRKIRIIIVGGLGAFILHLLVVLILVNNTELGIKAVVCGMLVFWLVVCVTGFISVGRYLQYSPDWLKMFGVTIIAAGIAGLIAMLVCKALFSVAGSFLTLLVCTILCLVLYNVILILLKGVGEEELMEIPGGKIVLVLAEKIHLI